MRTCRLPRMYRRLLDVIFVAVGALALAACVESEQPLLPGSERLFGDEFQLTLFGGVTNGLAEPPKISVYRWNAGRYDIVKGGISNEVSVAVQHIGANETLVQAFDGKRYRYLLARQLAQATYEVATIEYGAADISAMFKKTCVKIAQVDCTIATRAQLDAFVQGSRGKPIPQALWSLAVLSRPE